MTSTQIKGNNSLTIQQQAEVISRFEALSNSILIAQKESLTKEFDYEDKKENKLARSWVASLRKIKASIERERKAAKEVHIERGRAVDAAAKELEKSVLALIEPHERELKALEAKEEARVTAHRAVLDQIASIAEGITTSAEAQERLLELAAIDTRGLEEFATAANNRIAEAGESLKKIWNELVIRETEQAELEQLRAEKAARDEADRIERIRMEVAQEADQRAAEAEQRAMEAEARAAQLEELAEAVAVQQAVCDADPIADLEASAARENLIVSISEALAGKHRLAAATAIVDGTLHPAIVIDWTRVN